MSDKTNTNRQSTFVDHEQPPFCAIHQKGVVRHTPLQPHNHIEQITPVDDVFVLGHHGIIEANEADWWLDITGLVRDQRRFSLAELKALPKQQVVALHECAGFPMQPTIATRRYANVVWGGVDLADLLATVDIDASAEYVWSYGVDHGTFLNTETRAYVKDMPVKRFLQGGVLLAYEMNGEPLSIQHGFPLRLVVPGYYATNSVKWIYRIELSESRSDSIFTTTYYNDVSRSDVDGKLTSTPVWQIAPESIIVEPSDMSTIAAGQRTIWGWAWASEGLGKVEVSCDGGLSWQNAILEAGDRWGWRRFSFIWHAEPSAKCTLLSRAYDVLGACQPARDRRNSIYEVNVRVR